jgi:hypothetical protein
MPALRLWPACYKVKSYNAAVDSPASARMLIVDVAQEK